MNRLILGTALCLGIVSVAAAQGAASPEARPARLRTVGIEGEAETPIIAIYTTQGMPRPGEPNVGPQVIVAIWSNGRVVWSGDTLRGGPPYSEGQVSPEALAAALDRLAADGLFAPDPALSRAWWGPDARTTQIVIDAPQGRLQMGSWHELAEVGGRLVATDRGIEALAGRTLEEVHATASPQYHRFLQAWDEVKSALLALVPSRASREGLPLPFEYRHVRLD